MARKPRVGNDNNLPFSSSRDPNKADDDEFMLLDVADFLKASELTLSPLPLPVLTGRGSG